MSTPWLHTILRLNKLKGTVGSVIAKPASTFPVCPSQVKERVEATNVETKSSTKFSDECVGCLEPVGGASDTFKHPDHFQFQLTVGHSGESLLLVPKGWLRGLTEPIYA